MSRRKGESQPGGRKPAGCVYAPGLKLLRFNANAQDLGVLPEKWFRVAVETTDAGKRIVLTPCRRDAKGALQGKAGTARVTHLSIGSVPIHRRACAYCGKGDGLEAGVSYPVTLREDGAFVIDLTMGVE